MKKVRKGNPKIRMHPVVQRGVHYREQNQSTEAFSCRTNNKE